MTSSSTVVGQQQRPPPPPLLATTTTLTVTSSSPSSDNNNQGAIPAASSYDFLDNGTDEAYLTTIDLSGTQQQQQQLPQLQCHTINEATSYDDEGAYDFDNDDFDISAIDNQVKQYNESKPTDSDYIAPPPPDAPIHNRQYCDFDGSNGNDVGSTSQKGPLFLSFTRYIIRQVKEDSNTYTKTIHVSLSNPKEEVAYEDETERLKKVCSNRNDTANHTAANSVNEQQPPPQPPPTPNAVRAPLKYIGPYPCLALRFPHLATSAQRARGANVTGISLDFVLDTAANTNTIQGAVAQELALEKVGQALPGVGAAGSISGGDTYLLGNCQLDYGVVMEAEESSGGDGGGGEGDDDDDDELEFTFMQGLTASALPVASPAAAGLLGLYFFQCFQGGVMFEWGSNSAAASTAIPSITFFADKGKMGDALDGLARVPIQSLPVSALPSINMIINGKTIPALLDTGSPITVVNAAAAKMAGVTTAMEDDGGDGSNKKGRGNPFNPFAKLTKNFEAAQAAARGDVLLIAGADGKRVELVKSKDLAECGIVGDGGAAVNIGKHNIYVGDLPGLAAFDGLGGDGAPPAAVLGMDILRTRSRMVYRKDEVYL